MIWLAWCLVGVTFVAAVLVAIYDAVRAEFQRWTVLSIVYLLAILSAEVSLLCRPFMGWRCVACGLTTALLTLILLVYVNYRIFTYLRKGGT